MQSIETIPGKWYAVTSASGCTVTFETKGGTVTLEMKAPQDVFCAVGGSVSISDDSATLTQTFNLAPSFFKAARGWGQDPIWFQSLHAVLTRLLDGTQFEMVLTEQGSKLIVHTDRVADDLLEQVRTTAEAYLPAGVELAQYNHHIEISWRDINKYASCKNKDDMESVNANYKRDLTSDGTWAYPLPNITGYGLARAFSSSEIKSFEIPEMQIDNGYQAFYDCTSLKTVKTKFPKLADGSDMFYRCDVRRWDIELPKLKNGVYFLQRNYNLTEFTVGLPSLTNGDRILSECKLNKESAVGVLNSLPTGSAIFTIGIHIDHQADDEVLEAIANAEAKGWKMTVQWMGTPTAQAAATYGLRKPPIYARVLEHNGEMELDWAHYVTNEEGYETFRSLESAYEYFGLPMPEES